MLRRLKNALRKYREIVTYMIFGGLTTVVNYAVYLVIFHLFCSSATASNAVAWVVSVLFAFFTNKPFVFQSHDWSLRTTGAEFVKFIGCRVASGLLETGVLLVTVDIMHWDGTLMKLLVSVFVVLINYVGSKLLFHKKSA